MIYICLIFFFYNFAMMPMICIFSLMFSKPSTGVNAFTILSIFICKISILKISKDDTLTIAVIVIIQGILFLVYKVRALFWVYPLCTLLDGLFNVFQCKMECKKLYCSCYSMCTYNIFKFSSIVLTVSTFFG